MGLAHRVSVGSYVMVGVVLLGMGTVYVSAPEFMPYHAQAAGSSWDELGSGLQGLILGYLKLSGAGGIAAGASVLVLTLLPFRRGEDWSRWATPGVALSYLVPAIYATLTVISRTGASPPIGVFYAALVLVAVGATLSAVRVRSAEGSLEDSR